MKFLPVLLIAGLTTHMACTGSYPQKPLAMSSSDVPAASRSDLHTVFFTPVLRTDCISFMKHVLQHTDPQQFFTTVDECAAQKMVTTPMSDADWYKALSPLKQNHVLPLPYNALRALSNQKKVLKEQATQLLKRETPYTNCVEIGTPATYASLLKAELPINGTIYAVNETQQLSDAVQAFAFKPLNRFCAYDAFVPIGNYDPIAEEAIPTASVDLVTCFIGLNHIPVEKLDDFVASIARILRPGGVFLLRDHDAATPDIVSLAHAAHTIFNLYLAKASLDQEIAEYRNFQALPYWMNLLSRHGFECGSTYLLQEGDSSKNTLFACAKRAHTEQERMSMVTHDLHKHAEYVRDDIQGILTTPEWHNVHTTQAYARFINHTPFYEFPFFDSIKSFWRIFAQSFLLAKSKKGTWATLKSDYTQMNLFIGAMTTLEYGAKGLISLPLKWLFSGQAASTINLLIKDPRGESASLGNGMKIIKTYPGTDLVLLEVPRYIQFLTCMHLLAKTDIEIVEIAGQQEIQFTVAYQDRQQLVDCLALPGCSFAYDWHVPTQQNTHAALMISVNSLKNALKKLADCNVEVVYIHDF